jgi:hypothetical protein
VATVVSSSWNAIQRTEIEKELANVLASPPFTNSQRCTSLLRHLVELTLNGEHDRIKERTLGIEVFHRDPQYDLNADPIVRRIASETRKRLTQHYQDNPNYKLRIRLEAGSYVPQFDFEPNLSSIFSTHDHGDLARVHEDLPATPGVDIGSENALIPVFRRVGRKRILLGSVAILLLMLAFALAQTDYFRPTSYLVWKPLLASRGELIVCVSDRLPNLFSDALASAKAKAANRSQSAEDAPVNLTAAERPRPKFIDMMTAFKITKQLNAFGRDATLIPASSLSTRNLSNGPIILVGGINYPLSMMLQAKLRYSFRLDRSNEGRWIEDAQNPGSRTWRVDGAPENAKVDYGMVTRFWDSDTGGWVFMVCGIGPFGTEAAANLVTDQISSRLIPNNIRSAQNFQIVVKTTVIDGSAGAPQILAVQTW